VDHFNITYDKCLTEFNYSFTVDLLKEIGPQLKRIHLPTVYATFPNDTELIKGVITDNASLKVNFGWSFEGASQFTRVIRESIDAISPKYINGIAPMVSDMCCSWIGFVPYNSFDVGVLNDMSNIELILLNNEIVNYQIDNIEFIVNHPLYRQHALMRDDRYRFEYFRKVRKDPDLLSDAYSEYMDAVGSVSLIHSMPRDIVEEQIGCHFLYNPDLFFELLEFSILKGKIHE
jgi:hypothetical protein